MVYITSGLHAFSHFGDKLTSLIKNSFQRKASSQERKCHYNYKREIQPICIECSWNLVWDCKMLTPFIITGCKICVAGEDDTCKNVEDP